MTDFMKITSRILDLAERALNEFAEAQETMVAGKKPEESKPSEALNTLRLRVSELTRQNEELRRVAQQRGEELAKADRIRPQVRLDPSGKGYFLLAVQWEKLGGPLMAIVCSLDDFNLHVDTHLHIELNTWLGWEVP